MEHYRWIDAISNAIGIIVGNVTTRLLAHVTIIMALSAETLEKKWFL
jgi:magnesium-transporting ATPase (P-type)